MLEEGPGTVNAGSARPVERKSSRFHRLRDDLRCVLEKYKFEISEHLFTSVTDLFDLYLSEDPVDPPPSDCAFRSALGRIYVGQLKKHGNLVGIISPFIPAVSPAENLRTRRFLHGQAAREQARTSKEIAEIRKRRAAKRIHHDDHATDSLCSRQITFRYMDEFLSLECSVDLIEAKIFPNAKELTESMSAFNAVREYLLYRKPCEDRVTDNPANGILSTSDPTVTAVVVGDGTTPRTAALFAFRTSWRCVSIDPALRTFQQRTWAAISRLEEHPRKVQDVSLDIEGKSSKTVVVIWHAHVSVVDALSCLSFDGARFDPTDQTQCRRIRSRVALVACSCCQFDQQQEVMPDGSPPDFKYEDFGVPSLKRTVKVWQFKPYDF